MTKKDAMFQVAKLIAEAKTHLESAKQMALENGIPFDMNLVDHNKVDEDDWDSSGCSVEDWNESGCAY